MRSEVDVVATQPVLQAPAGASETAAPTGRGATADTEAAPAALEPRDQPLPAPREVAGDIQVSDYGRRLRIPASLPGAQAPEIRLPPYDEENLEFRNRVIDKLFPDLPKMWPLKLPRPTAARPAITLDELQDLALRNNPVIVQAWAAIQSYAGDAIQAGTAPNPMFGYESDTVGSALNRDYQGLYMSQMVKTANKLGLQRSVANVDTMNAQLAFRRTRFEVLAQVKANYFAVLVAQENVIVSDALVRFTTEVLRIQELRLKQPAAPFEAAQLRGLADQARTLLVNAQNSYVAAWKVMVANLGLPLMPPAPLAGRADMPVPAVTFEAALHRMLSVHPDILIGRNMASRARLQLQLERRRPIPDVFLYATVQKDFTTPGVRSTSYNTQIGVPVPLWDRNRGNIISTQGDLIQAAQQQRRAENELTAQLANTFSQYETNRIQAEYYSDHILPDFTRAYRGVYERHQVEPDEVGFEGVIVAQQNLATAVATYIATLNGQWAAVADLCRLMQVERLEELAAIGGARRPPAPSPAPPAAPPLQPAGPPAAAGPRQNVRPRQPANGTGGGR